MINKENLNKKYVICVYNFDSFDLDGELEMVIGPFFNKNEAEEYAEARLSSAGNWFIKEMYKGEMSCQDLRIATSNKNSISRKNSK